MRDPLHWVALRHKLALMFVGLCLLAFGVGGYLVSASARGALEREIQARLDFQARAYATALDGELRFLTRRLEDFASDGYIRGHVEGLLDPARAAEEGELRAELARHLNANKLPLVAAFLSLRVVDDGGRVLLDTLPKRAGGSQEIPAPGAPTSCSGLLAPLDEEQPPRLVIATELRDLTGARHLGRVCADVGTAVWIRDAMRTEQPGASEDGAAVELRVLDGAGRALRISRERIAMGPANSDLALSNFGLALEDAASARDNSNAGVNAMIERSFPISVNQWQTQVSLQADSALRAVAGLQTRFLLVGAVLALISAALLYFPLRFLTQSLAGLRDAAARIQEGDFTTRVEVATEDELGDLAHAFNLMAAAVEERNQRTENSAQALRTETSRLSAVIASMRDGLIVLGPDGNPLLHNRAAEPLLELVRRDRVATSHHHCHEDQVNGANCKACLFDVEAVPRSCVIEIEGGVFEVRSTRLAPDARGHHGRVLVSRDITDRVAQDEREIHQERLAVLGEVAAVMAHELNNPLAAISMFNQMLATEIERDSPLRENVEVIQRNVETCKHAIRDLLEYANNALPEVHDIDVEATLEDVAAFLRPMRQRSNVEIETAFGAGGALVRGDEVQLRQIFVNLILNSIQACGGRPGRVIVRTHIDGEHVAVDVRDNGSGVPPGLRAQIFKPFFTTKPRGEGTGLGLSTARRIAEMHGGSVELVESSPSGTMFRVRLRRSPGSNA
jgi:signal transduction histidine kinase